MEETNRFVRFVCRYDDIRTYTDNRVILKPRGNNKDPSNSYINASFVDSPFKKGDQKIIAAQGPLK